jgi:hypothetical protein
LGYYLFISIGKQFYCSGCTWILWLPPWFIVKGDPKSHPWLTEDEKISFSLDNETKILIKMGNLEEEYTPTTGHSNTKRELGVIASLRRNRSHLVAFIV